MGRLATLFLALLALAASLAHAAAPGPSGGPTEYEVKAAFLYKFATYTAWPEESFPSADAPFVIGVLGSDPFGATLDRTLKDKKVGGHPVRVERYESREKVGKPHLLFVAGSDPEAAAAAAKGLMDKPILLVGDCAGFATKGAICGFYLDRANVHFEMNPAAAKRSRLVIQAQLLKLARIVEDKR